MISFDVVGEKRADIQAVSERSKEKRLLHTDLVGDDTGEEGADCEGGIKRCQGVGSHLR